ncbi:RimK family alpha-L-glutamate ligase [Aureimonas fodinaquatilis]|uniref:RimK family alpha-L-glutamate ligase n=1 Tax=Aureimonas fodinaquatilis TaxID=2565783 RepID=A0A5B0DQ56_9HYPH|nr:RimK family alpha-L-glutamate ligase [Aureimonas fodinaquatilis]KAA0968616.1 RimK family alpha-L-glutamate ligase [Aureimonas fodinaquatilis]
MRIALLSASRDRHARQLVRAFSAQNADALMFELADVAFDSTARHGLVLPHFGEELPDAVCLRTMNGGSFEAVTRRLSILHALSALGVPVSNTARAVECCTDKSMTSFLLAQAKIPSPRSKVVETRAEAEAFLRQSPVPLVLKPLFGAQGKGIALVETSADLPEPDAVSGVYYLQEFAGCHRNGFWSDYRLMVSNGRVVAAMMRRSSASWITNIKQGAQGVAITADADMSGLAVAAAAAVGASFCGVDILQGVDGTAQVIEVNSMPAWTGLQRATGIDIAAIRAGDLIANLPARISPFARAV